MYIQKTHTMLSTTSGDAELPGLRQKIETILSLMVEKSSELMDGQLRQTGLTVARLLPSAGTGMLVHSGGFVQQ